MQYLATTAVNWAVLKKLKKFREFYHIYIHITFTYMFISHPIWIKTNHRANKTYDISCDSAEQPKSIKRAINGKSVGSL